jgi:transposase-like protein
MKYRRFTQEFKRSTIEQLLSETVGSAELCRRYDISSQSSLKQTEKKESSLPGIASLSKAFKEGVIS